MKTYCIGRIGKHNGQPWRAYAQAFSVIQVETGDRRAARKVVRLARRLGYTDVRFWLAR